MNILLNTIVIDGRQMTHVWELANKLHKQGYKVCVAFKILEEADKDYIELFNNQDIPIFSYFSKQSLLGYCKQKKVDVIHAHSIATYSISKKICKELSIPLILTIHREFNYPNYFPSTLRFADKIIALGASQAQSVGTKYKGKLKIIQDGIDIHKFRMSNLISQGAETVDMMEIGKKHQENKNMPLKILWYAGNDYSDKAEAGISLINEAIKIMRKRGINVEARLIGNHEFTHVNQFEDVGWVDDPIPYLQWGEVTFGYGHHLIEAMACGNVIFNLINDDDSDDTHFSQKTNLHDSSFPYYCLTEPTPDIIVKELTRLYENRSLLLRKRMKSRRFAEKHCNVSSMIKRTIKIYKTAYQGKKRKLP